MSQKRGIDANKAKNFMGFMNDVEPDLMITFKKARLAAIIPKFGVSIMQRLMTVKKRITVLVATKLSQSTLCRLGAGFHGSITQHTSKVLKRHVQYPHRHPTKNAQEKVDVDACHPNSQFLRYLTQSTLWVWPCCICNFVSIGLLTLLWSWLWLNTRDG